MSVSTGSLPSRGEPRTLGLWMCTALIVGNVIGMGVFVLPAALAPYGLNAFTGWLITMVGFACLAIAFSGLARNFPLDDGPYAYTMRAFGEGPAFTVMWCYWVSVWVTNAAIAIGVVGYATVLWPVVGGRWLAPLTALSLLWLFVLINLRGARAAGWVQILTTLLKVLPLVALSCLGVWLLITRPSAYVQHLPPNRLSFVQASGAATIAMFAMLGIECASIPAARVRDPQRTIARATLIGTLLTAVIYIGASTVPMLLIPQRELAASNAPIAELFARLIGPYSGEIVAVFVIISGLGALNGWTLMVGEVTQGLARHGRFPRALSRENAHGAPTLAFIVTGAIASLMLLANYDQSIAGGFTFLSVVVTAANLPMYILCCLAVLVLRRRDKLDHGLQTRRTASFAARGRLWGVAAAAAAAYCFWVSLGIGWKPLLWTSVLGAVGAPVYLISLHWERRGNMSR